jgi:hypothetical protein
MNIDPKLSCTYLVVGQRDPRVIDECMKRLSQKIEENLEALSLHTLLTMSNCRTGREEGKEFERVASDPLRPWPTRAMAWKALARSDGTRPSLLIEAAAAETEPNMRRALLTTLKRFAENRQCKTFLADISKRRPEIRYTVEWVKAAA